MSKKSNKSKDGTPILIDYSLYRDMQEDVREGSQAADELTSVVAQIIYKEIKRRKEFRSLLMSVEQTLSTSMRRVHRKVIELRKENSKISKEVLELEFDLERIREVVMSPNLEQMRTLIEDIYDWRVYRQSRLEKEMKNLQSIAVAEEKVDLPESLEVV
jgi:hypothetical protein